MALKLRFPNIEDNSFFKFQVWHKSSGSHYATTLKDFGVESNLHIHLGKEGGLLGGCDGDKSKKRPGTTTLDLIHSLAKKATFNQSVSEQDVVKALLVSPIMITSESNGRHLAQQAVDEMVVEANDDPEGKIDVEDLDNDDDYELFRDDTNATNLKEKKWCRNNIPNLPKYFERMTASSISQYLLNWQFSSIVTFIRKAKIYLASLRGASKILVVTHHNGYWHGTQLFPIFGTTTQEIVEEARRHTETFREVRMLLWNKEALSMIFLDRISHTVVAELFKTDGFMWHLSTDGEGEITPGILSVSLRRKLLGSGEYWSSWIWPRGGWKWDKSWKNPDEQGLMSSLAVNGEFAYTCLKSEDIPPALKILLGNFALYNVRSVSKRSSSLLNDYLGAWLTNPDTNVPVRFMSDEPSPSQSQIDAEVEFMYRQQLSLHGQDLAVHRLRNVKAALAINAATNTVSIKSVCKNADPTINEPPVGEPAFSDIQLAKSSKFVERGGSLWYDIFNPFQQKGKNTHGFIAEDLLPPAVVEDIMSSQELLVTPHSGQRTDYPVNVYAFLRQINRNELIPSLVQKDDPRKVHFIVSYDLTTNNYIWIRELFIIWILCTRAILWQLVDCGHGIFQPMSRKEGHGVNTAMGGLGTYHYLPSDAGLCYYFHEDE